MDATAPGCGPPKKRRGLKAAAKPRKPAAPVTEKEGAVAAVESRESAAEPEAVPEAQEAEEKSDRRGIIHLASLPSFMPVPKLRQLMESFGEVGRIYMTPEADGDRKRRRRRGGTWKKLYLEGWVEFMDRRVAKRVALSLNGNTVSGKKRNNDWHDNVWNMRYLPKFKWYQLKESAIYTRQVRKARLQQKLDQAHRENNFYLEQVEQARRRKMKAERLAAKRGEGAASGNERPGRDAEEATGRALKRPGPWKSRPRGRGGKPEGHDEFGVSDRVLESLLW